MASPDRTLLTEADVTSPSSKLGETVNGVRNRLGVVEVATGTQYGNVPTLTNVTEIPTDVSGRIDLVYTQPTTVSFDAPGLTDIVVSIEGYEHITWEGVAVHGLPDVTGVVWASAMWRDRDSTWHLLCEQDPGSGGGGGKAVTLGEATTYTFAPVGEAEWTMSRLLGGTEPRPARTVAANGAVTHEVKPLTPEFIAALGGADAAATTFPHGLETVINADTGESGQVLVNYGGAFGTPPQPWYPGLIYGTTMIEYGTIATPGGQGFRFTPLSLSDIDFEAKTARFVGTYEITQDPLSFGVTSSIGTFTSSPVLPGVPGYLVQTTVPVAIPGQTGTMNITLFFRDPAKTGSMRISADLRDYHIPNPIPAPPVDEDGFAIHKIEIDTQVSLLIVAQL